MLVEIPYLFMKMRTKRKVDEIVAIVGVKLFKNVND